MRGGELTFEDVSYSFDLLGHSSTGWLPDDAFAALMRLVSYSAGSRVSRYSEPTDGAIPSNDKMLARITRLSPRRWAKVKPWLTEFFDVRDGKWYLNRPWISIGDQRVRFGIPQSIKEIVRERQGQVCTYCGAIDVPFEYDHIFPVSKGGTNDPSNLTLACNPCNRAKGAQTLAEWRNA